MKIFFYSIQNFIGWVSCIAVVFFCCLHLQGQFIRAINAHYRPIAISSEGEFNTILKDTSDFHLLNVRFRSEVAKRTFLNLDTFEHYGKAALLSALKANYPEGVIDVYLSLGNGYVDKYSIDSAKHYYMLAIQESKRINNARLLSKSHLGYGWALIYDNSDYVGSVRHFTEAQQLASPLNDTSLQINILNKLVKIYFLKLDLSEAYASCMELQEMYAGRNDTLGLINSYYMLGSIYGDMDLFERQMEVVYQLLKLAPNIKDSLSIYLINSTASQGYLNKQQYDSTLFYSRLNLPLAKSVNRYPVCYGNMAKTFLLTNQLDSARFYYEKIIRQQEEIHAYIDTYLYLDLGDIEFNAGNHSKALAYYKKAESQITKPSLSTQREIYRALYHYHKSNNQDALAFRYLEKYKMMTDSTVKVQNSFHTGLAVVEYETEKLQSQLQLLTKDKELQTIVASKRSQQERVVYSSIILVLILIGLAFIRFRRQKMLKARQDLLNERLRISRELHDEVGSTLSGISMYSHLALDQVKNADIVNAENSLRIMQRSAGEMIGKLSDIVWLLNPEQHTISEMFDRLIEYARQMGSARNMEVKIDIPASLMNIHIPLDARRNIYLFCKEAINNAVKYSNGSYIELKANVSGSYIRFSIRDDGQGFDEMTIRRGHGLRNMLKRCEDIGALCNIASRPNQGAHIEMEYRLTQ